MVSNLFLALAVAVSPAEASTGDTGKVTLSVGEEKVLSIPGLSRIAIADPTVFDVHVQPNGEVLVLGKALGHSSFIVWRGEQRMIRDVEVTDGRKSELDRAVHALPGMEDVRVEQYDDKFVLQGHVDADDDLDKLNKLLASEASAVNLVKVERQAELAVVERINVALHKAGLNHAKAAQVGNRIFLEGQVEDDSDLRRAELIANTVAGNPVEHLP